MLVCLLYVVMQQIIKVEYEIKKYYCTYGTQEFWI